MIDLNKMASLQKASKASFQQQKLMIKKLMMGQKVLCSHCQQALILNLPHTHTSIDKQPQKEQISSICCAKGCTDIVLDFVI